MVSACARVVSGVGCVLLAACSALRPEDVPEPAAATAAAASANDAERAKHFPGADALLRGFDFAGERQLRDGDTLLFGVTVQGGERKQHRLLQLVVEREDPELKTALATLSRPVGTRTIAGKSEQVARLVVLERPTRKLQVALRLFEADGRELAHSRLDTMDVHLESSFVAAVQALRRGDVVQQQNQQLVVHAQLGAIATLLANDPVLKQLLAEVASVPFDLRLLWRRELSLECYGDKAVDVEAAADVASPTQARMDLPFDLFLNDSLLVRLSVAIAEPHGPTAAVAGIVRLLAQQADRPDRQLTLELLAAARGPQSEFAAHGAAAFLGTSDEGVGLAFSPDARWLALPGPLGTVELRDLQQADPSVPCRLLGAFQTVRALHFLDARTLLVARGAAVECFDCTNAVVGGELRPVAKLASERTDSGSILAIEPAGQHAVFVGWSGAGVERWTFNNGLEPLLREVVRAATFESVEVEVDGVKQKGRSWLHPPAGWLLGGGDADRCVVRVVTFTKPSAVDSLWQRQADGTWEEQELPALAKEKQWGRRARWRRDGDVEAWDEVAFGTMLARPRQGGAHAAVAGVISLTTAGTRLLGTCHANSEFVHGFSPDGRFYAYCAGGHRVLAKVPPAPADAPATK
jgi:hypothetical protein